MHARLIGASMLSLALVLSACGGDDDDDEGADEPTSETTDAPVVDDTEAPDDSAVSIQVAETSVGEVLVDGEGDTLYAFTNDVDGTPTCADACAGTWPAAVVDGEPTLGEGLEPAVITTVAGADGGTQLKAGDWPLYEFTGDSAPGDVNGQGVGDVWFVVAADGTLIQG